MRREESPEDQLARLGVRVLPAADERPVRLNGEGGKREQASEKSARFPLVAFDDVLTSTTSFYLIKNLIPREGLVVVWGPPKCGKSFGPSTS
jgi:hypothetical protein